MVLNTDSNIGVSVRHNKPLIIVTLPSLSVSVCVCLCVFHRRTVIALAPEPASR